MQLCLADTYASDANLIQTRQSSLRFFCFAKTKNKYMKLEGIAKGSSRITSHKQRVIDLQEQIPPAKFDWTSSGLTNPLEGPGKLS